MIFFDVNDRKASFFARTMHTPDDPTRAEQRDALREISRTLMPLHRRLIEAARSDFVFMTGADVTPSQLLELLQTDPFFEWLKPVTRLIVDIDEMTRTDFAPPDIEAIAERIERLFGAGAEDEFTSRYVPILQREVDVAIGHAAVRRLLSKLRG